MLLVLSVFYFALSDVMSVQYFLERKPGSIFESTIVPIKTPLCISHFLDWLAKFSAFISKTAGKKEIMLFNNGSSEGTTVNLSVLNNERFIFLPPSTTWTL